MTGCDQVARERRRVARQESELPQAPLALAFDGTKIWVANFFEKNVEALVASSGKVQGEFGFASNTGGVAFDGANIWVTP